MNRVCGRSGAVVVFTLVIHFAPYGKYFAHQCANSPFSFSVDGAQTRVLHAPVKKKIYFNLLSKVLNQGVVSGSEISPFAVTL